MNFLEALNARILQFDGAMGTMLEASGAQYGGCPESLNLNNTDIIRDIHALYRMAGADVVETNTLGANSISLGKHGLADSAGAIVEGAVRAAREAVKPDGFVALSMGPTGELLAPLGTLTLKRAYDAYADQAKAAMEAGADLIFMETTGDIAEARIAAIAAREASLLPVVVSFTFESGGRTMMGHTPEACALSLWRAGASAVGINCSTGPAEMVAPLEAMRAATPLPVIAQPNAGMPYVNDGQTLFPLSPEGMRLRMDVLLDAGAAAIGGCCGTTPEHIARMKTLLEGRSTPKTAWDKVVRVSSMRQTLPLEDALGKAFACKADIDALFDAPDEATALLIDARGISPASAADFIAEAQQMSKLPLLFKSDDADTLRALLLGYHGAAGVEVGAALRGAAEGFGAVLI